MKNTIEIVIVMFTMVFGMSLFNWLHNFTPSFNQFSEIEVVSEEQEEEE